MEDKVVRNQKLFYLFEKIYVLNWYHRVHPHTFVPRQINAARLVSDVVTLLRIVCEGVAFNICIQSRKTSANQSKKIESNRDH